MNEDPATPPAPAEEEHLVRHRKRRRHRFRPESEALARHREDMRALSWILPCCLLALGGLLLFVEFRNPEPATRAKDLVAIGFALAGAGAVWLAFDLAFHWIAVVRDWSRENESSEHRHHRHHRSR